MVWKNRTRTGGIWDVGFAGKLDARDARRSADIARRYHDDYDGVDLVSCIMEEVDPVSAVALVDEAKDTEAALCMLLRVWEAREPGLHNRDVRIQLFSRRIRQNRTRWKRIVDRYSSSHLTRLVQCICRKGGEDQARYLLMYWKSRLTHEQGLLLQHTLNVRQYEVELLKPKLVVSESKAA